jgi:hypothetical protein
MCVKSTIWETSRANVVRLMFMGDWSHHTVYGVEEQSVWEVGENVIAGG